MEKVHAVVARSTFPSKHVYKLPHASGYFWRIRLPFHVEKVHTVVARSTVPKSISVQNTWGAERLLDVSDVVLLTGQIDGYLSG